MIGDGGMLSLNFSISSFLFSMKVWKMSTIHSAQGCATSLYPSGSQKFEKTSYSLGIDDDDDDDDDAKKYDQQHLFYGDASTTRCIEHAKSNTCWLWRSRFFFRFHWMMRAMYHQSWSYPKACWWCQIWYTEWWDSALEHRMADQSIRQALSLCICCTRIDTEQGKHRYQCHECIAHLVSLATLLPVIVHGRHSSTGHFNSTPH